MFRNKNKSDKLKSYFVAFLFIVIAVIGIWLTFSKPNTGQERPGSKQHQKTTIDSTAQSQQGTQFKSDSIKFSNYNQGKSNDSGGILKTIIISILFIIIITIGLIIFKKKFSSSKTFGMDMEILGKKYFGQKQFLMMVRVENKKLLLGITDHSINLVKEFGEIEEEEFDNTKPNKPEKNTNSFSNIIRQISFKQDK